MSEHPEATGRDDTTDEVLGRLVKAHRAAAAAVAALAP